LIRYLHFALLLLLGATAIHANGMHRARHPKEAARSTKSYLISGQVQHASSYCGGVAPTPQMIQELSTARAFPNKKFYVRKGSVNSLKAAIILSFASDSLGRFSFSLPPDTYAIILDEQVKEIKPAEYNGQYQHADAQCLKNWWAKPYYLLVIKDKNIEGLNFVFHHRCFLGTDIDCVNYLGPMPP
jgi:hypothetical protein